jgi:hypothetical protein
LRTGDPRLRAHAFCPAAALGLALLAVLGNVRKLPGVEKDLFICCKDELSSAVDTLQYSIGEFHFRLPKAGKYSGIGYVVNEPAGPGSPFSSFMIDKGPGRL